MALHGGTRLCEGIADKVSRSGPPSKRCGTDVGLHGSCFEGA